MSPVDPKRIVWREVEARIRPIDCGLVVLANGTTSSHGDGPDSSALESRVSKDLTEFSLWWLRGHGYTVESPPPHA